MRTGAVGGWLAVGLLLGCGTTPSEVVGVYEGRGSSSGDGPSDGPSGGVTGGSSGAVADGSGGSDTGTPPVTSGDATTHPADPSTTDPGTTGDPPASTGSTSGEPGSSSGGDPLTCGEIFGAAQGYVYCSEDAGSCTFSVVTNGNSCTTICSSFGQVCIDALDNPGGGDLCMVEGDSFCENTSKGITICICSR